VIRELRADDWALLREVRLRALQDAPYAFLSTYDESVTRPDESWQEWAAPKDSGATFVLDGGDRFDGMVSCFVLDDPSAVLLVAMWVAPERRGGGAASALVDEVVAWARRRGAERVVLTVEKDNERAAALYRKCGFEPTKAEALPYEAPEGSTTMVRPT
jgi:ribosomal protein S18 acetylase RimI-like enzyme